MRMAGFWFPLHIPWADIGLAVAAGVAFSVLLTALPGIGAVVAWLMTVVTGRKLD